MRNFFLIVPICLSIFASSAFACGGGDLSDTEIEAMPYVQAAQSKMASAYGTTVVIESIVRSGSDILDLEKKTVASAMCAANFINVYFKSTEASQLVCKVTFQIKGQGKPDFKGLVKGLLCRANNSAEPELIDIDKKSF